MGIFSKIKEKVGMNNDFNEFPEEFTNDYVQIDAEKKVTGKTKVIVRPFMIEDFSDIKPMLDAIREGYTIALVNIKPLKDKDIMELKRAVGKLKKTCEAIEGDIAGFGEDWLVITPSFAQIHRDRNTENIDNTAEA
ncbi:MAG TPA: cell division protein SepF [Candidatus Nanoarchaeia archaeon]|nr:cell division protein SepF [Candidatus Nanoarchaeia archaeon]